MNQSKLSKTAKKLDTLFKILQKVMVAVLIAAACVFGVLTILHYVNPDAITGSDFQSIKIGQITLQLEAEYEPDNNAVLIYSWIRFALAAATIVLVFFALKYIRLILQPMIAGNPFNISSANYFKKLAYISIGIGAAYNAAQILNTTAAIKNIGLIDLTADGKITHVTANYSIDLTFLVVFFVLLLVSCLFQYGAELQQLSDETL